ncbi:11291_t:CDS:2 [Racocetra persica]|uniref:11291_t:CDS:1 n=1 Tax=Racocetra persica TaxID=160502 RepID=A0ACA9Q137_9GLOM|nr:11291_t:CDS:2 [Racocetra persica]
MGINKPLKFSNKLNSENSPNSFSAVTSEIPSFPRVPLYTCKGENCNIKCPPHTRKCSECGDHNYLARRIINRKYYASQKSRLNSENSISSINKSFDSINDMDLKEIWNNAWSEILEHQ